MQSTSRDDLNLLRASLADDTLVLLDGFHAVKHAIRFGADIALVACASETQLAALAWSLAPDIAQSLIDRALLIPRDAVDATPALHAQPTGVWGVARRPTYTLAQVLNAPGPVVLLENPQHQGNIGACIRVSAAAGAAGLVLTGNASPWTPAVVRGAAGLQFAISVLTLPSLDTLTRPLIAIDPDGDDISRATIPANPVLAFGTERHGLSPDLLARATQRISLPMQPGVSSINLATAVGITLYAPAIRRNETSNPHST